MKTGRTALITGASAGLGAEFARQLSAQGYNLILVARRRDKMELLAAELQEHQAINCHILTADLSDPAAPQALYESIQSEGFHVDFLVNNAGIAGPDLLEDRDWQAQADFYQLMMTSIAHLCHLFIPGMRERGFGRVINVASVAGRIARADGCNYSSSKAYLVALSESLSMTLKGTGVHVCALCPGFSLLKYASRSNVDSETRGVYIHERTMIGINTDSPSTFAKAGNAGRTLIHEWLHRRYRSSHGSLKLHRGLDEKARGLLKSYGLGDGGCEAIGGFRGYFPTYPGCN